MLPILLLTALFGAGQLYLYPGSAGAQTVGQLMVAVALPLAVALAIGRRRSRARFAGRIGVRQ